MGEETTPFYLAFKEEGEKRERMPHPVPSLIKETLLCIKNTAPHTHTVYTHTCHTHTHTCIHINMHTYTHIFTEWNPDRWGNDLWVSCLCYASSAWRLQIVSITVGGVNMYMQFGWLFLNFWCWITLYLTCRKVLLMVNLHVYYWSWPYNKCMSSLYLTLSTCGSFSMHGTIVLSFIHVCIT